MLIHVGLHKTGTTYLQRHVFTSAELGFCLISDHKEIISRIVLCNPFAYSVDQIRDIFGPRIDAARRESLTPVISCERLSGSPASGECWWPDGTERLIAAFPDARLVVTIREQVAIIASIYKHLVRNWLSASIDKFLDQEPLSRGFLPLCRLEYYEYDWMIRYCAQLVGSAERVHVIPFEWLRDSPERFVRALIPDGRGADVSLPSEVVNRGFCALACSLQRRANMLSVSRHFAGRHGRLSKIAKTACWHFNEHIPAGMARRSDAGLKQRIREIVGTRYGRSNAATEELAGIDLSELGYQLPPS